MGGDRLQGALATGRSIGGGLGGAGGPKRQAPGEVADYEVDDGAGDQPSPGHPVDPAAVGRLPGDILCLVAQVTLLVAGGCIAHGQRIVQPDRLETRGAERPTGSVPVRRPLAAARQQSTTTTPDRPC